LLLVGYNGLVMRLSEPAWQVLSSGRTHWLKSVWSSACDRLVTVGARSALLVSEAGGLLDIAPDLDDVDYTDVWVADAEDFFVTGSDGLILRYRSGDWTVWRLQSRANLEGVWGAAADDVFAVGAGGVVVHFDGESWTTMDPVTTLSLSDVHGRSGQDVCAVGLGGALLHYDGTIWRVLDSRTQEALHGVWCREQGETVAVGGRGLILHNAGAAATGTPWEVRESGTASSLYAVTGHGEDLWAGGAEGSLVRSVQGAWTRVDTGDANRISGLHIDTCGNVFVVGFWGVVLRYGP
jgi:hypothetical protein